jgi:ABC-type branched-subunit amino acid transport system ATPase component
MAGLVTPSEGSVLLDGTDIISLPAHRRAERGMLVTPESRGIFPGLNVEENLMLRLNTSYRDQVYERFPLLGQRRRLDAGDLSGGEQQMLALAPVVVRPPRLVIADEPTLGLAPRVVEQLLQVFKELRDHGSAILLVEEKVRDILTVADQVAFIKLGHILWSGARADLDDDTLVGAYLGSEA